MIKQLDQAYKTFFPFTGQENYEKERQQWKVGLQNDLKSYLNYQKSQVGTKSFDGASQISQEIVAESEYK